MQASFRNKKSFSNQAKAVPLTKAFLFSPMMPALEKFGLKSLGMSCPYFTFKIDSMNGKVVKIIIKVWPVYQNFSHFPIIPALEK